MFKRLLIAAMLSVLVILAACAPATMQARPLNRSTFDKCAEVTCGANMHCDSGQCLCTGGFKQCGDGCISESKCCSNSDCGPGRTCDAGVCVERPVCGYLETWDDGDKECACVEDAKFCAEQGKCVPAESCCWHTVCDDDQRCAVTTYSGTVCIKADTKKCKIVHEDGRVEGFFFPQGRYDVQVTRVLEGGMFDLKVNEEVLRRLDINETTTSNDNVTIYVESMQTFGGYCRDEPD